MSTIAPSPATDFVPCQVQRSVPVHSKDDVVVFIAYCPDGLLTPLQRLAIDSYVAEGYLVALVVNSGGDDHSLDPGLSAARIQIVRENIGFDFGGWGHGARLIGDLANARSVTFANDSLVGPLPGDGNGHLRELIDETSGDVVFLTESVQIRPHGQSYFFALKKDALKKGALDVVRGSQYFSDKKRVVLNEELTLASRLSQMGMTVGVAFPCPEAIHRGINPTFFYWDYLLSIGFPFVKVSLVPDGKVAIDDAELAAIIGPAFHDALRVHLAGRPVPPPIDLKNAPQLIRR